MYWRDYYPTHEAADEAGRLGDLGKIKLTPAQKAAIQSAKADAKVAKVQAKAALSAAKRANKLTLVNAKAATKLAKQTAAQAKYAASATDAASVAPQQVQLPAAADLSQSMIPFAQSGGGGGGAASPAAQSTDPAAAQASDTIFGLPSIVVYAGAGLLLLLLLTGKK